MTDESPPGIGTVAQEAARLIEDMATMAHSGYNRSNDSGGYAEEPPAEPASPDAPPTAGRSDDSEDLCSMCGGGGERDDTPRDDTPSTCKICPLCKGIALLRSVRPETVDMLADLALSVAAGLRDVATRTRASDSASSARSSSGGSSDSGRDGVQDIPVDDESEGRR